IAETNRAGAHTRWQARSICRADDDRPCQPNSADFTDDFYHFVVPVLRLWPRGASQVLVVSARCQKSTSSIGRDAKIAAIALHKIRGFDSPQRGCLIISSIYQAEQARGPWTN